MKKIILLFVFLLTVLLLCSCDNKTPDVEEDTGLAAQTANPIQTQNQSSESGQTEITESPTPQIPTSTVSQEVELDKEAEFYGNKIMFSTEDSEEALDGILYCTVNGNKYKLSVGTFLKGYILATEEGNIGFIISAFSNDSQEIVCYKISDSSIKKTFMMYGTIDSLENNKISVSTMADVLGTWSVSKEYEISPQLSTIEKNDYWTINYTEGRELTAKCDIPAACDGKDSYILAGSVLNLVKSDLNSYCVLEDVSSGSEYTIKITKGQYGICNIDNLGPEEDAFSNISYSG